MRRRVPDWGGLRCALWHESVWVSSVRLVRFVPSAILRWNMSNGAGMRSAVWNEPLRVRRFHLRYLRGANLRRDVQRLRRLRSAVRY